VTAGRTSAHPAATGPEADADLVSVTYRPPALLMCAGLLVALTACGTAANRGPSIGQE
jgi:hypothetical protein